MPKRYFNKVTKQTFPVGNIQTHSDIGPSQG